MPSSAGSSAAAEPSTVGGALGARDGSHHVQILSLLSRPLPRIGHLRGALLWCEGVGRGVHTLCPRARTNGRRDIYVCGCTRSPEAEREKKSLSISKTGKGGVGIPKGLRL